ncbi:F510_1955 family glycosylhydrolase [Mycolicibacterium sediminis]|uniref:Glycosyl hydrolase n=1 Tax=Mycolicibacterium sediminis TaxID=1286180 RepID=A0A7I7QZ12_9MYCO|nr:exo-alpha-sialidase [Mycolicibacterium sediminis]BBY31552.1 hypothetical protein MSEDJ_56480 [Mycolicibacterium sediminis]
MNPRRQARSDVTTSFTQVAAGDGRGGGTTVAVRIAATIVACALSVAVVACSNPQSPSAEAGFTTSVSVPLDAPLSHLHGLHVDRSGTLLAGTHSGLFSIDVATGVTARVGDSDDDFMGLGGASGTDDLVSSGHPGPSSDAPNPLGLRASRDGGQTWMTRSRSGSTDFHALATDGTSLVGSDGRGLQTSNDGGVTWNPGADVTVGALTITPSGVWAVTPDGAARSTDGGRSFTAMPAAPPLALISGTSRGLWGVDGAGYVWSSADGAEWDKGGRVGAVQALTSGPDGTGYAASSDAVYVLERSDATG